MRMRNYYFLLLACLFMVPLDADATSFGFSYTIQGQACDALGCNSSSAVNSGTGVSGFSNTSFSIASVGGFALSSFSGSISGTEIHGISEVQLLPDPTFVSTNAAGSRAFLQWFDTFTFQPGTYQLTILFDQTYALDGPFALSQNSGGSDYDGHAIDYIPLAGLVSPGGPLQSRPDNHVTMLADNALLGTFFHTGTLVLTYDAVTTVTLGQELVIDNNLSQLKPSFSATAVIDQGNTASFTVVGTSAGSSFTTASGETYSTPNPVPEPSSLFLIGTSIGLLALTRRLSHLRRSASPEENGTTL
jgi:hypothetical protein